ncbi:polysaccharide deacetylase family protein [Paenibacillus sp. GCM10027627]|uniref:polysaccharide deacetylase family protein n=1 Tax=unclassified Paenibacillus TaxID=185978 RepID=UPI0036359557
MYARIHQHVENVIWEGAKNAPYYAITFDDGPYILPVSLWLDALEAEGAVGTFFFTGEWMDRFPEQAKEIIRRGHALAPHSHFHRRMAQIPKPVFQEELKAAELAYQEATGLPCPAYMRFPYCSFDEERLEWLKEWGYYDIEGQDSGDWMGISAGEIAQTLIPHLENGYIAVMHSNDIAIGSPGVMKPLCDAAKELGLTSVPVPAILETLGIPVLYRRWKIVVEVPSEAIGYLDYPADNWSTVVSDEQVQMKGLASQLPAWGVHYHVNGPETEEQWLAQLQTSLPGGLPGELNPSQWFGVREFDGSYWGYARAYALNDTFVIHEHASKEFQADTLVYLLRWSALQAVEAGLTRIEARQDIRRMLRMCEQLGWKAELVLDQDSYE